MTANKKRSVDGSIVSTGIAVSRIPVGTPVILSQRSYHQSLFGFGHVMNIRYTNGKGLSYDVVLKKDGTVVSNLNPMDVKIFVRHETMLANALPRIASHTRGIPRDPAVYTCYVASALQLLNKIEGLPSFLEHQDTTLCRVLAKTLRRLSNIASVEPIDVFHVKHLVGRKHKEYLKNEQNDSSEFLFHLIDAVDQELFEKFERDYALPNPNMTFDTVSTHPSPLLKGGSPVLLSDAFFALIVETHSTCLVCRESRVKLSKEIGLVLATRDGTTTGTLSIQDLVHAYSRPEYCDDVHCNMCSRNTPTSLFRKLASCPPSLLVTIRRSTDAHGATLARTQVSLCSRLVVSSETQFPTYECAALNLHQGSNRLQGHYVASVKNSQDCCGTATWTKIDDDRMSVVSERDVLGDIDHERLTTLLLFNRGNEREIIESRPQVPALISESPPTFPSPVAISSTSPSVPTMTHMQGPAKRMKPAESSSDGIMEIPGNGNGTGYETEPGTQIESSFANSVVDPALEETTQRISSGPISRSSVRLCLEDRTDDSLVLDTIQHVLNLDVHQRNTLACLLANLKIQTVGHLDDLELVDEKPISGHDGYVNVHFGGDYPDTTTPTGMVDGLCWLHKYLERNGDIVNTDSLDLCRQLWIAKQTKGDSVAQAFEPNIQPSSADFGSSVGQSNDPVVVPSLEETTPRASSGSVSHSPVRDEQAEFLSTMTAFSRGQQCSSENCLDDVCCSETIGTSLVDMPDSTFEGNAQPRPLAIWNLSEPPTTRRDKLPECEIQAIVKDMKKFAVEAKDSCLQIMFDNVHKELRAGLSSGKTHLLIQQWLCGKPGTNESLESWHTESENAKAFVTYHARKRALGDHVLDFNINVRRKCRRTISDHFCDPASEDATIDGDPSEAESTARAVSLVGKLASAFGFWVLIVNTGGKGVHNVLTKVDPLSFHDMHFYAPHGSVYSTSYRIYRSRDNQKEWAMLYAMNECNFMRKWGLLNPGGETLVGVFRNDPRVRFVDTDVAVAYECLECGMKYTESSKPLYILEGKTKKTITRFKNNSRFPCTRCKRTVVQIEELAGERQRRAQTEEDKAAGRFLLEIKTTDLEILARIREDKINNNYYVKCTKCDGRLTRDEFELYGGDATLGKNCGSRTTGINGAGCKGMRILIALHQPVVAVEHMDVIRSLSKTNTKATMKSGGNALLSTLVKENIEDYYNANNAKQNDLCQRIVERVHSDIISQGSRFLQEQVDGSWRELSAYEARKKVKHAFRTQRIARSKLSPEDIAELQRIQNARDAGDYELYCPGCLFRTVKGEKVGQQKTMKEVGSRCIGKKADGSRCRGYLRAYVRELHARLWDDASSL